MYAGVELTKVGSSQWLHDRECKVDGEEEVVVTEEALSSVVEGIEMRKGAKCNETPL